MNSEYLERQLSTLWRVIYVLVILVFLSFFVPFFLTSNNTVSSKRIADLELKVYNLKAENDNLRLNQKNLFRNDSVIVSNQKKMQDGQRVSSFASFLAKMLL